MSLQYSVTLRNNQLDQVEATVGASARLHLLSGAVEANCAAASTGTLCVDMGLPADWMAAAAAGSKAKSGTWSGTGAVAAGTGTNVGHFRIMDSTGTTCHLQGTVTITGGGGDMTVDNINIASGQAVTINSFSIAALNA